MYGPNFGYNPYAFHHYGGFYPGYSPNYNVLPTTQPLNPQWFMPQAQGPSPYTFEQWFTYPGVPDLAVPVNAPIANVAQLGNLRSNSGSIFDVLQLAGQPSPLIQREANRLPPLYALPDFGLISYS